MSTWLHNWGVPLPGHRTPWSLTATLNVTRAGEWILLSNSSAYHRAWLRKHMLSPQQMITNWLSVKGSYLNMPAQLCRKLFFFHIFDSCFASEQIYGHARRKQPLVLLPLQRLWEKKCIIIHSGAFKIWSWLLRAKSERMRFTGNCAIQTQPSKHSIIYAALCVPGTQAELRVEGNSKS